jgi:N-acetylneuraminic acid mutarotase
MPSALLDGRIYTPGGLDAQGAASALVEVYDPSANRWGSAPPMPEARHHHGVATAAGKLYVLGGYLPGPPPWRPSDAVFVFDLQSQSWSRGASMPAPRAAHTSVELGGKIYSIGGVQSDGVVGTNEVYDPSTNSWTALAPMPTPREHLAAAAVGSRILVVGGRAPSNRHELEAYSPADDQWERLQDMPTARGGLAAAALGDKLYAVGGEVPGVFSNTEQYDAATNTWRAMAGILTPRHGMGAVPMGDELYVIGGGTAAGLAPSGANEVFSVP